MKKLIYLTPFLFLASACTRLDIVPKDTYTTDNFYKTKNDAIAAVNAVYSNLTTANLYNQFMEAIQSQGTDDAEWGYGRNTSNIDKNALDKFTYDASTDLFYRFWSESYTVINNANTAVYEIGNMENLDTLDKNQYIAEARFVRALMYFNLVRLFGRVPLKILPTTSLKNLEIARSPLEDVYNQIIRDFNFGVLHLPKAYDEQNKGRATKGAAMAMLAKVYLTRKDYAKAAEMAENVMELDLYSLWPDFSDVFLIKNENTKESIFEIQYESGSGNIGSSYAGFYRPSFDKRPGFGGYGDNPVTKDLYEAYSPGDKRRDVTIIEYSYTVPPKAPTSIKYPYYVAKYKDPSALNVEDGGNNYYIVRYADVLLMYAEAEYHENPGSASAYESFNKVRRRAYGLPINQPSIHDLTSNLTLSQFEDSVLLERRLEFAFEGQRRFDLLRTGKLKEAMQKQDPSITVEDRDLLFPIPELEMEVNPLLEHDQNPGY